MSDLVTWLRAQLDEDERLAQDAPSELDNEAWPFWVDTDDDWQYRATNALRDRFPPSRLLAEVEAKRRILDWIADTWDRATNCDFFGLDDEEAYRILALPYADRDGYREEWRPA